MAERDRERAEKTTNKLQRGRSLASLSILSHTQTHTHIQIVKVTMISHLLSISTSNYSVCQLVRLWQFRVVENFANGPQRQLKTELTELGHIQ